MDHVLIYWCLHVNSGIRKWNKSINMKNIINIPMNAFKNVSILSAYVCFLTGHVSTLETAR